MTVFVLDCSVTMTWILPDEATAFSDGLQDLLEGGGAVVPALWPAEVANAFLGAVRRNRADAGDWPALRALLGRLPVEVEPVSTDRTWGDALELARVHRLSAYDAMYLELAARRGLPLATMDRALAAAGRAEGIDAPAASGAGGGPR